jgi:hypothetical protein
MFNPEARWDRPLPQTPSEEREPIVVVAGFKPAVKDFDTVKIRPFYFIRKKEPIKVDKINYSWVEKRGQAKLYYFSVSAGGNIYYLCLDAERMNWSLRESRFFSQNFN